MRIVRRTSLIAILLLAVELAYAGGIHLSQPSINGHTVTGQPPYTLSGGQQVHLCFNMEGYSYSGRRNEGSYAVFSVAEQNGNAKAQRASTIFVMRFDRLASTDYHAGEFTIQHCVDFTTPVRLGSYAIRYSPVLMFPSDYHVNDFNETDVRHYAEQHLKNYPNILQVLVHIQVSAHSQDDPAVAFSTYLRLNGQVPSIGARVEPGLNRPPVVFSWFTKPDRRNAEHRYRLYPVDPEWSPWTSEAAATYYFIGPGGYQFQVVSRVRSASGQWIEGQQAEYQFVLEKPLIAKPIPKASQGTATTASSIANPADLYLKSRALLIGVTKYEDKQFGPLPFTVADVTRLEDTLKATGFDEVTPMQGSLTKAQITKAIDQFTRAASKDERLLIYISTHGFADSLDKTRGYIVSTDCNTKQPSTCLSLQELDSMLEPVLKADSKAVRHLLVLLDTCSSGLGVIAKSGRYSELSVAAKEGSHLMTAGLADQEAEQDPGLGMSTFTYYLDEGLSGKADYTQDGVVSLSELLVYVRYNVANRTGGRQTPMVGRLNGAGEMIFWPSKTR